MIIKSLHKIILLAIGAIKALAHSKWDQNQLQSAILTNQIK